MKREQPQVSGLAVKKQFGQHFLRVQPVVDHMIDAVQLASTSSVFEIGCGDGFLTRSILKTKIARLWVFEIDPEWAHYVAKEYPDKRMTLFQENFLDLDFSRLAPYKPWVILANLPYQVTFPILHSFVEHRALLQEGVVMVQEEVAQKITKTYGRGYGYISLFFQHYFEFKLLDKVPPAAFFPPPKVTSRLIYFKPRKELDIIPHEAEFWQFIKRSYSQPRRTLRNNLASFHYDLSGLSAQTLALRAQQMSKADLLAVWQLVMPN